MITNVRNVTVDNCRLANQVRLLRANEQQSRARRNLKVRRLGKREEPWSMVSG